MTSAETYVTVAYLAFLAVLLLYGAIYSFKIAALDRAVAEVTGAEAAAPRPATANMPEGDQAVALR